VIEISAEPLQSLPDWTRGEVVSILRNESVIHLDDIFQRRSSIAWVGQLTLAALKEVAEIAAVELGWQPEKKDAEITRTVNEMREKHGINLA
jgi:Glycerol-3-phosphate dehydrogenase